LDNKQDRLYYRKDIYKYYIPKDLINLFRINTEFSNNKITKATYYKYIDLKDVIIEVETKITIEYKAAIGIITLLDTTSLAL